MAEKPQTKDGYNREKTDLILAYCVEIVARLNDLKDDLVIIGGLVPTLLIDSQQPNSDDGHVGTTDIDLGFALQLVSESRYEGVADRLKRLGFAPNIKKETGEKQLQTWYSADWGITIDFLMPLTDDQQARNLPLIGGEMAAFRTPGLSLAFRDRELIQVRKQLPGAGFIEERIPVCGPGAFVVLKAHALKGRSEPKDAYDLHFMVRHAPGGVDVLAKTLVDLTPFGFVEEALEIIGRRFASIDEDGAHRVANFLNRTGDDGFRADVVGNVQDLLRSVRKIKTGMAEREWPSA